DLCDRCRNAGEIALAVTIGRHIGRDIDEVTGTEILNLAGKGGALSTAASELVEARLDHRQPAGGDVTNARCVAIVADDAKAFPGERERRHQPQMGQPGKADDRRAHGCACAMAAWASRRSIRFNRTSFDSSVSCLPAQSFLKWAYSSSQVGSSCVRVTVSSGGRPLGSKRRRSVNDEGPHLHSERM